MNWREQFRSAFATLIGHHWNQSLTIDRAATAKAWGLEPDKFASPFTQQTVTNVSNTQPASPLRGLLTGAALATALLGGGGIGGFLLSNWLKPEAQTVEKITKEVWDSSVKLEVEPPQ